ncbi:MAG TPA: phage Gp37/Gp68 family protein [Pseudorhizobium sp.]|nr:phage Gp37/Gp68 family protein [Pseudorhizobium sp.]
MADRTKIEWSDATWNPITGCDIVSPGCTNCYAMRLAGTRLKKHPSRAGLTRNTKAGPVWTGAARFNEKALLDPLRWTRPRMIFVVAHGDLFAEAVPDAWIDQVFAVMALCPQHTFQILTKRPERMRDYLTRAAGNGRQDIRNHLAWEVTGQVMNLWHPDWRSENVDGRHRRRAIAAFCSWPLPNVWLGVSVEDQKRADERIPPLLDTPAALHWLSAEPMLGPLDLEPWMTWPDKLVELPNGDYWGCIGCENAPCDKCPNRRAVYHCEVGPMGADGVPAYVSDERRTLGWIVAGGESGPSARPAHPDWFRSLRDQCAAAGTPFLFKQWGNHRPCSDASGFYMLPCSKAEAGRLLDGQLHDEFPALAK